MEKGELVRKFGTSGVNYFVHVECVNTFAKGLPITTQVIENIQYIPPTDLANQYKDIHTCDTCGKEFNTSDTGYLCIRLVSYEELGLLLKMRDV